MVKRFYSFLAIIFIIQYVAIAQIPTGYYNSANGLTGAQLKTALHLIIRNHTQRTYANLWTDFQTTDKKSNGKVWDMYSNCDFTFVTQQDGGSGGTVECQFYNREHSMPNSWWGGTQDTMYTDLFHLVPTDKYVNNARGNSCFGQVTVPSQTFLNGGKIGPCSFPGYTGTVFEPTDSFKGDFARNYFYLATRYENKIGSWSSDMLAGNSFPVFTTWAKNLLLSWNTIDPVSQKEIDRNNAVYGIQHNRNPFIDHPEYVNLIWGGGTLILVNSITIQGQGGITSISSQGGTLQMSASVLPSNATNSTYTWSVKNSTATINSTGLLTAISDGIDTVVATANDSSGVKGILAISISNQGSGINYIDLSDKVAVYPNPAVDELNVDIKKMQLLPDNITITDIRGKMIYQLTKVSNHQKIGVAELEKGMYFITISGKNCKSVFKFIR
ncbi:MAG: endonuclease [Bacteroidetes bacterium]|nr:endonuclease [Bacteroidota bacterium]